MDMIFYNKTQGFYFLQCKQISDPLFPTIFHETFNMILAMILNYKVIGFYSNLTLEYSHLEIESAGIGLQNKNP